MMDQRFASANTREDCEYVSNDETQFHTEIAAERGTQNRYKFIQKL